MIAAPRSALLTGVCLVVIAFTAVGTVRQLVKDWPIHQWESGLVAEAARAATGLPVYERPESGHATHMYGPASTWLLASVFRMSGPSFLPARLFSLVTWIATLALIVHVTGARAGRQCTLAAVAGAAAFGPCVVNFVEPRPDCSSLLCGTLAVILMARAWQRNSRISVVAATLLTVLAMLLKQPAAMVAAVPFVAAWLDRRPSEGRRKSSRCWLGLPLLAVLGTLLTLRWRFPLTWYYCVTIPGSYDVVAADLLWWSLRLGVCAAWIGLAFCGIAWSSSAGRWSVPDGRRLRNLWATSPQAWALATVLVTVPCSLVTAAKTGGNANSLLPAVTAAVAFLLCHSRAVEIWLHRPMAFGQALAALRPQPVLSAALILAFGFALGSNVRSDVSYGDSGFRRIVDRIRSIPGPVASPQDAAALVFAGRSPGRSLILEYDAAGWPEQVPHWFFDDLSDARAAITVGRDNDWRAWPLSGDALQAFLGDLGFTPVDDSELQSSVYQFWIRDEAAEGSRGSAGEDTAERLVSASDARPQDGGVTARDR